MVSTRVLSPGKAVIWAAFFNFVAAFTFGTAVASTVGSGMIDIHVVTFSVIFAGLVGAIIWDLITWYYGLPTSSSHALVGGYAGAAVAKAGFGAIVAGGWTKTIIFIFLSPLIGLVGRPGTDGRHPLAVSLDAAVARRSLVSPAPAAVGGVLQPESRRERRAEDDGDHRRRACSPPDTFETFHIPFWVVLIAHTAIGLGTLAGGWRIIHTMGSKITKLQPVGGFAAETGAALALMTATLIGVPVSTTHAITGAIVGVGSTRRLSAVRWGVAGQIVWAWVLTIPAAFTVAAVTYKLLALSGVEGMVR